MLICVICQRHHGVGVVVFLDGGSEDWISPWGGMGGGKVVMDGVEVEGRVNKEIDERRDRD